MTCGKDWCYTTTCDNTEILENIEVDRIISCNGHTLAYFADCDDVILSCSCLRYLLDYIRHKLSIIKVDIGHIQSLGEDLTELNIGNELHVNK